MLRTVVYSGIQPTGRPHLGNYLGAIRQWKKLSDDKKRTGSQDSLFFSIVNLHALTAGPSKTLKQDTREMMATLLATGLDTEQCVIYEQSSVRQHTELAWVLNCLAPVGRLLRMTSWKSKEEARQPNDSKLPLGLLAYSVLQAADILLFRGSHVPVGHDQLQHLELARDLALSMNRVLGQSYFPIPVALNTQHARIASLRDPLKKMSKSSPDVNSRILLTDDPETIRYKFKSAVTDNDRSVVYAPETRPGISNLVAIRAAIEDGTPEQICLKFESTHGASAGHAIFKQELARVVSEHCEPIREKFQAWISRPSRLEELSAHMTQVAQKKAEESMTVVREALGLR